MTTADPCRDVLSVKCPTCGAPAAEHCRATHIHGARVDAAVRAFESCALRRIGFTATMTLVVLTGISIGVLLAANDANMLVGVAILDVLVGVGVGAYCLSTKIFREGDGS